MWVYNVEQVVVEVAETLANNMYQQSHDKQGKTPGSKKFLKIKLISRLWVLKPLPML